MFAHEPRYTQKEEGKKTHARTYLEDRLEEFESLVSFTFECMTRY
jgi:hypothetical protein